MISDRNHFYVTLFCNGSQKQYPANTFAVFTARLAQPIDLVSTDRWEVGVCEFTCHPINTGTFASAGCFLAECLHLLRSDIATVRG